MDNDLVKLVYQAPVGFRSSEKFLHRVINDFKPSLKKIITNRGAMSDYNGMLSKISILYHWYFLWKVEYRLNTGMPHYIARINKLLSPLKIENIFLGYHSMNFYRKWYRNELSSYIKEILLDQKTMNRSYLNKNFISKIVYEHMNGTHNHINEIDKALTVELTHRFLLESW
jgi:hypothetical protein